MLAEPRIARHAIPMRRLLALLLIPALALVPAGCRKQPQGALKVVVIGGAPKLRDPALGPLPPADAVLLSNVAQGLVRLDANGNIVSGLAERWNVSDDGLSYIFRIASRQWPDGTKITAQQVAKLLKRQIAAHSSNPLKDSVGAIEDVVAMTDRVIEIQLVAPRPTLLPVMAQPEFAILKGSEGTGPFTAVPTGAANGELRLSREIVTDEDEQPRREQLLLGGTAADAAVTDFAAGNSDLVLGGTFGDLPLAQRAKLPRDSLRFDPASGLFGLVPMSSRAPLDTADARQLLAQALDRGNFVAALGVPGLAARSTLLEPGLDGMPPPIGPDWSTTPVSDRLALLRAASDRLFGKAKPVVQIALPAGPGASLLLAELQRDWGQIGLTVELAQSPATADFALIDEVAPSASASWFVRRFRCGVVPVCDPNADQLMDAARAASVPAQRYALLAQAAARIDQAQLFLPITAPVRWSLVSARVQNFAGNRYAIHTLTGLEQQLGSE